jgi:hypothetical protein
MSLDLESSLREFFAASPQRKYRVPTLQIGHSAMTKTYYLWREPYAGEITTEDGVQAVQFLPFQEQIAGSESHLDQVFELALDTTEAEDDFRTEMARIPIETTERVQVIFREYLSDDLTEALTRAVLQVESVVYTTGAAKITAVSPRLNVTRTGELYTPREIPMLRSLL